MIDDGDGQTPLESWHVSDDATRAVIPPGGFLQDLLIYTEKCTHAPLWFQMASALGMLITACAGRELRVARRDGSHSYIPMNFWPIIVGISGDGKDSAVRPAMRILNRAAPQYMLAADFTPEALQGALSEGTGIGMIVKSELSHLFKAGRRSYSSDLIEYLMALYNGDPQSRLTVKAGLVAVMRPRVSLIGNIPPDVLISEVSRASWSSGLLPRFTMFASTRTRWLAGENQDPELEGDFADWLKQMCVDPLSPIVVPPVAARVVDDWYLKEVEEKRQQRPPDVFSALQRLQKKAFRIAAVLAISESPRAATGVVNVKPVHAAMALEIVKLTMRSTLGIFRLTASGYDAATEEKVIALIRKYPGIAMPDLVERVGQSRYKLRPIIKGLEDDLDIEARPKTASEKGGMKKGYHWLS